MGAGRALGREANIARRVRHFHLEQSCDPMHCVTQACLRLSTSLTELSPSFARGHSFRVSGGSSCLSEIPIPSFHPPLRPLRNLSWFFWMDARRILIQAQGGRGSTAHNKKAEPGYSLALSLLTLVTSRAWNMEGPWSRAPTLSPAWGPMRSLGEGCVLGPAQVLIQRQTDSG